MRFCPLCLAPFLRLTETRSVLVRYSLGETAAVPEVETLHDVKNSLFRHCAIKTRQFTRGDCRCGGTTNSMGVKGVAYELALMSLQGLGKPVEGFFPLYRFRMGIAANRSRQWSHVCRSCVWRNSGHSTALDQVARNSIVDSLENFTRG
ncbi:hypothetical protein KC19_5G094600 [Ceratodon purpureus]|uniref:Uncharacterized protein n=1 Tax=Ceratodon purpureus TaxID=3225 RepID=A0A8T0I0S5_CERPU|nr:hypothetical protein KC19_5G094600 [Ceratodon purpureus]